MALIKDWIGGFLDRHRRRFNPHDWPHPESEENADFARLWLDAFLDARVREQEADTASIRLGQKPPRFRNDHLPAVMAEVEAIREANAAAAVAGIIPETRKAAEEQSWNCAHCGGAGLVAVFDRRYDGSGLIEVEVERFGRAVKYKRPARVAAHCVCPLGRFMRSKLDDDTAAKVPDLQRVFNGRSSWQLQDPTRPPDDLVDDFNPRTARARVNEWIEGVGAASPY